MVIYLGTRSVINKCNNDGYIYIYRGTQTPYTLESDQKGI